MKYKAIRENLAYRLKGLRLRLIYREKFRVFVSSRGRFYDICYTNLHAQGMTYDGLMAFIRIAQSGEFVLCELNKMASAWRVYSGKEVPPAHTRLPRRTIQVSTSEIIGYLNPCLKN